MKKFLALCLTLCMALSMSSVAFAAETPSLSESDVSVQAQTNNIDYYTYPEQILDGYKTVRVTPGSNEALKLHTYISSGTLTVWVKPASSAYYTQKANWNTNGHHYCDLVPSTNGGSYDVRIFGAASWFSGGIYSGN